MVPKGWEKLKWGDVATLEYGKSLKEYQNSSGTVPVYGTNGLIGYTEKPLCQFPSVIVGRKGAYRGIHYSKSPFFVIDTAFYVNPINKNLDLRFAYYQLLTQNINEMDSGSAIPSTSRKDFYNLDLLLPDLKYQQKIASILASLDDKIELNINMNKILEAIVQAIFKEWFVDFRFPGFDGKLVDGLPKGWRDGTVGDMVTISKESINPSAYPNKEFYHYSIPAFDEAESPLMEKGKSILSNKFVVKNNSLLISKLNPRFSRIWPVRDIDEEKCVCSTEFLVLLPRSANYYSFIISFLKQNSTINSLAGLVTGTSGSHQRIRPDDLLSLPLILPDIAVLSAFESTVSVIIERYIRNIDGNQTLIKLRDTLLPNLMTGKIKIA